MPTSFSNHSNGPVNLDTPIQFSAKLPDSVDVLIIGGGIIGVSTALYLAEQNKRVLLCEKGRIAGEQSSRNWGWVRQQGRDADELPLMMEANRIWQGLAKRCQSEALRFEQRGIWYLANQKSDIARYEDFMRIAREHSLDTQLLSKSQLSNLFPLNTNRWLGALHTPSDGRAEPWVAVPAMAKAAEKAGALIREQCAVRSLITQAGTLTGVMTENGLVKAGQVVLAGGAWSSLFARNSGIELPQLSVRACAARVDADLPNFHSNAHDSQLAFRRRQDGGFNIALCDRHDYFMGPDSIRFGLKFRKALYASWQDTKIHLKASAGFPDAWSTPRQWKQNEPSPFETMRVLEPTPEPQMVETMLQRFQARFTDSANIRVTHSWAGMIDATPDLVPVIDKAPDHSNLWIATGFSGHGFGIGPAIGRILSDLMQSKSAGHDMSRFRFSRFSDGSPIIPGPSL